MNIDQWAETCHATSTVKECSSELVCGFFKNTVGSSNYKMLNDAMKNKQEKMWKEIAVAHSTVPAVHQAGWTSEQPVWRPRFRPSGCKQGMVPKSVHSSEGNYLPTNTV